MAARKQLWHPDAVRQKIQASQLINRLQDNANADKSFLDQGQLKSIEILLKKSVPDLQSVMIGGDPDNPLKHEHSGATDAERVAAIGALLGKAKT